MPPSPPTRVDPPDNLLPDERRVWDELAPLALQAGTLVSWTRRSFVDLVRARLNRDQCRARVAADGWVVLVDGEPTRHPLEPALRGWEVRVDVGMAKFALAPAGRAVGQTATSADPFAEFERRG